ncbi:hypothetical protein BASA81_012413 [Batrachochytrium salamandrivorans]|nr:hypothetical protein BASA81_012413 [Batrachochytrium salamandrivorans]
MKRAVVAGEATYSPAVSRMLRDMQRQEAGRAFPKWFASVNKQDSYYYQFKHWFERNPVPYVIKHPHVALKTHPHFTLPMHSIEYERTYRMISREENVPFQDFREHCATTNSFDLFKDLGRLPYKYSGEIWQVRFQAMFDFNLFRGRAEWKQDLERIALAHPVAKESSLSMIAGILEGGMEDELFDRVVRRVCCYGDSTTKEQLLAGYDGGSVAKAYTNFGLVAHQLHTQVKPPHEHLAAIELEHKRVLELERRAKEGAEKFGTLRAPFEVPDLAVPRTSSKRRQNMDSFPESLMRVGIKLFDTLKSRVTFDGEPLFTLMHDQFAFRQPRAGWEEAHYDFHMTDFVQLNPRLIKLLKLLSEGDPPKYPKFLVENNRAATWERVQGGLPTLVFNNDKIPGKVSTFYYSDKPELATHIPFMRTNSNTQTLALSRCEYPEVIDGLNALGSVKWGTNWSVMERMHRHYDENRIVGDITRSLATLEEVYDEMLLCAKHYAKTKKPPKRDLLGLPKILRAIKEDYLAFNSPEKFFTKQEFWEHFRKVYLDRKAWGKLRKETSVGFSKKLSCESSVEASKILNQSFSIPYNLDFRGRAYPIAKALTPIGDDFNRGVLKFERDLPLGHRGLFWLKVQLANQFGQDKQSFDRRARWTDKNMAYILQSIPANEPRRTEKDLTSLPLNQFWTHSKNPTQAYAACYEVACAMRNEVGGPEAYLCGLPVHMDGSCNGLQHYSAISRDEMGGRAVNLGNYAEPQDVYGLVAKDIKDTMDHYAYWWNKNRYNPKMAASLFTRELRRQKPNMPTMEFWDDKTGVVQGHRPYMKRFQRSMEIEQRLKQRDMMREAIPLRLRERKNDLMERMILSESDPNVPLPEFTNYFTEDALNKRAQKIYHRVQDRLEIDDVRQGLILQFLGGSLSSIIDRSLVKQTVMTAVYGVTSHGAQRQIHGRLSKLADSGQLPNLEQEHIAPIARFLTSMTMEATEAQFEKCFETMAWLKMLAKNVTKHGHKLAWTTPLGLPCIQTYDIVHDDRKFSKVISHHNQRLVMNKNDFMQAQEFAPSLLWGDEDEAMLGPSKSRQGNAFPPNFVHSLDSTHMLVTAKRCVKANVDFAAVHDSYWCHPSNVDFMSRVLREEFVALHERDLVGDLLKEFQTRYPQIPQFYEIPEQGHLNLREVLDSPYFFS